MKPSTRIFTFEMQERGNLADDFRLKTSDGKTFRPCDFGDVETGGFHLPWMTQKELVAWLKKAASKIEEAKFE